MADSIPGIEDPLLAAAALEKLRAETDKLRAELRKIEAEALVVPKQAIGSYWSEIVKIVGAVVLGIGGIVTAVGGYFATRYQVELAELRAANAGEKQKSAESAASAASLDAKAAIALRDSARKEQAEAGRSVQELRDAYAELTRKVQNVKPELVGNRIVYIQFQGSLARQQIDELRKSLTTVGFNAPGAERLAAEYRSQVKYFRSEDQGAAEALRKQTEEFFAARGCPIQLRSTQAQATAQTPPLELWLSHSCKQ